MTEESIQEVQAEWDGYDISDLDGSSADPPATYFDQPSTYADSPTTYADPPGVPRPPAAAVVHGLGRFWHRLMERARIRREGP